MLLFIVYTVLGIVEDNRTGNLHTHTHTQAVHNGLDELLFSSGT